MASKMNELHMQIGESMRNGLKKSYRKAGGLMEILGTGGLIATGAVNHLVNEV